MKLLYSVDCFPKLSETFVLNEIIEVQRQGIEVAVLSRNRINEKQQHEQSAEVQNVIYSKDDGVAHQFLNHFNIFIRSPFRYFKALKVAIFSRDRMHGLFFHRMGDVLNVKRMNPDFIHAHFGGHSLDFALLCKLLLDIDYTFTTHRWDIFDFSPNYKLKTNKSIKHITISKFNKNYLINKFDLDADSIDVIHCGIDFRRPEFREDKELGERPEFREDKELGEVLQFLNVGRLVKQKNQLDLIKICSVLKENGLKFVCKIIGEGESRESLEQFIESNSLQEEVKLLGPQSQGVVFAELRKTDIFILTSISEGIPVSLMEAMAFNVPVVSSKINGIPELIDQDINGCMVEVGNIQGFVDKINFITKNVMENGRGKIYKEFNLEKEVEKLIALWK